MTTALSLPPKTHDVPGFSRPLVRHHSHQESYSFALETDNPAPTTHRSATKAAKGDPVGHESHQPMAGLRHDEVTACKQSPVPLDGPTKHSREFGQ